MCMCKAIETGLEVCICMPVAAGLFPFVSRGTRWWAITSWAGSWALPLSSWVVRSRDRSRKEGGSRPDSSVLLRSSGCCARYMCRCDGPSRLDPIGTSSWIPVYLACFYVRRRRSMPSLDPLGEGRGHPSSATPPHSHHLQPRCAAAERAHTRSATRSHSLPSLPPSRFPRPPQPGPSIGPLQGTKNRNSIPYVM